MKRRALAILLMILPAMTLTAQDLKGTPSPSYNFNWGLKMGFAATGTYLTKAEIDGHKLPDYTQDTQVGNFIALQLRITAKSFIFQTGVGLNSNRSSFFVDKNGWDSEATTRDEMGCSFSALSMSIPLQIGYHVVDRTPYRMTIFTGPRLRYAPSQYYTVEYTNTVPYEYTDKPTELTLGWTAGLSIHIGRTFLDFEYEATINNVSHSMYETTGNASAPSITLDRRVSIISFSYGIMF
jgi:hypothetical protein